MDDLIEFFKKCGFSETRAKETSSNAKTATAYKDFFARHAVDSLGLSDKQALLLLEVAKSKSALSQDKEAYIVSAVADEKLKSVDQVKAAVAFLAANTGPIDTAKFDEACGVGITLTPEQIYSHVKTYVVDTKAPGWAVQGKLTGQLKSLPELRWAASLDIKNAVEKVFTDVFGPKPAKVAAKKPVKEVKKDSVEVTPETLFSTGWLSRLHKPGENAQKIPERMVEHLAATKGQVFTRFPPEPNGFLHIGHSKSITINFGFARYHHGHCYLRYDDTNPEAEEQIYIDKILECIRWLGFEPYKITYSSDHFQELHDLAVELIKRGLAYTSDDSPEEMAAQRGGPNHGPRYDSKDRTKPVDQILSEFADMKAGKYKPGEMVLRMKMDMQSGNPCMWDLVAYRVLLTPHPRTGTDWVIYPTYDFTHCLCDSFENISHSLCTTEFITARESYEWLCDALEVYKPRQSEFGRLNLEGAVMSKRRLLRLVREGHVKGWDDPRMYTLMALKRRGVPPAAIIAFVSALGVSTAVTTVQLSRFEQTVRQYLEAGTPRLMMVLNPVKVTIENLPADHVEMVSKPFHPKDPDLGSNSVPFTSTLYIDRDDFRAEASSDFFRLAPGATVGLLHVPHPITYVSHTVGKDGEVEEIVCRYEIPVAGAADAVKPRAWIQWVGVSAEHKSPVAIEETRIFSRLFLSDNPASLDDYLGDLNPDSLKVVKGALVETGIHSVITSSLARAQAECDVRKAEAAKTGGEAPPNVSGLEVVRFQGMRIAYFCLDLDSDVSADGDKKLVLNMIAPLKQDTGK